MNNKLFTISTIALLLFTVPAKSDDIATNTARMQAMDKITGRVSEINVPVNGLANFGSFSILVRKCVTKSPEETPENTAFVDIVDNYKTNTPINIFKGWMFSSSPALNAVEHPIYDIWLVKCFNSKHPQKANILNSDQLALRDTIPMVRPEKLEQTIRLNIIETEYENSDNISASPDEPLAEPMPILPETANDNLAPEDEEYASEGEEFIEESEPASLSTASQDFSPSDTE